MKLGLALEYAVPKLVLPMDVIREAEAQGFDAVWSAEAYGSDAITPLAYIAAHVDARARYRPASAS